MPASIVERIPLNSISGTIWIPKDNPPMPRKPGRNIISALESGDPHK